MRDIKEVLASIDEDIVAVTMWASEMYDADFAAYFVTQQRLYTKLAEDSNSVTDAELEEILTSVPLELFAVSERVSGLKLKQEVIKLKMKEIELEYSADPAKLYSELSESKRRELASYNTIEYKLTNAVLSTLISRVENEISFSKELVMSAKKIWDRRRDTESAGGIASSIEPRPDLPDYA